MRRSASISLQALGLVILSVIVGGMWWRMWMYYGWIGSPRWLSYALQADGEGSYQATMLEMMLISFIVFSVLLLIFNVIKRTLLKEAKKR